MLLLILLILLAYCIIATMYWSNCSLTRQTTSTVSDIVVITCLCLSNMTIEILWLGSCLRTLISVFYRRTLFLVTVCQLFFTVLMTEWLNEWPYLTLRGFSCEQKRSCTIDPVNNATMGDDGCPGVGKYLQVRYNCIQGMRVSVVEYLPNIVVKVKVKVCI